MYYEDQILMTNTSRLCYRYVELVEWMDIQTCGRLRPGENSCGDGKWLAEREQDAWMWGGWFAEQTRGTWAWEGQLEALNTGRVIVLEVPVDVLERSTREDRLDGIGPAVYIESEDLATLQILHIVEQPNETTEA